MNNTLRRILMIMLSIVMSTGIVFAYSPSIPESPLVSSQTVTGSFYQTCHIAASGIHSAKDIPVKCTYRITYNANNGKIISATINNLDSSVLQWDNGLSQITSIQKKDLRTTINGSKITFSGQLCIGTTYFEWLGGPSTDKLNYFTVNKTISPHLE